LINVVRTVIAAAAQPTAAKIADVFGRLELIFLSITFYVVGTIIEASSHSVSAFCAGAVIYEVGLTIVTFLVEVIVADISSLQSRLLWSYIAATPFIINTWVSGTIAQSVLETTTWRWGVGMWAIIYPVLSMPLIISLLVAARRAAKRGDLVNLKLDGHRSGFRLRCVHLFWNLGKPYLSNFHGMLLIILCQMSLAFYSSLQCLL
jgi:SIT family siderophore-iron:H+ symporter-like MFS transporter